MQSAKEKIKERERGKSKRGKSYYSDIVYKERSGKMKNEYNILKNTKCKTLV